MVPSVKLVKKSFYFYFEKSWGLSDCLKIEMESRTSEKWKNGGQRVQLLQKGSNERRNICIFRIDVGQYFFVWVYLFLTGEYYVSYRVSCCGIRVRGIEAGVNSSTRPVPPLIVEGETWSAVHCLLHSVVPGSYTSQMSLRQGLGAEREDVTIVL